jgi:DNA-binding IscR family transcriptional regulator
VLAKPAKEINIYNIYASFEDDLAIIDCLLADTECPNRGNCVLRDYWCDLNDSIKVSMSAMDVETLANKHRNGNVA